MRVPSVTQRQWHGLDCVQLGAASPGAEALIARRGATLLALRLAHPSGAVNIVDGYANADDLASGDDARCAILAPFSNRLAAGQYRFDGVDYRLPRNEPGGGNALHGLVSGLDWHYLSGETNGRSASVEFGVDIPADPHGYPFHIGLRATFTLTDRELQITLNGLNRGERPAPFGCGWHPYLRAPSGDIDSCRLRVPAAQAVATDDSLLPLPGAQAFSPLDAEPALDLRAAPTLRGLRLDRCYTQLAADADGWVRSHLLDPIAGVEIVLAQDPGAVHVFTAAAASARPRTSVAIEPTEFIPDAFNRPELATAIRLEPGAERRFRFQIELI